MTSTCSACEGDNHNWGPRHHALIASLKEADASLRAELEAWKANANESEGNYQRTINERDELRELVRDFRGHYEAGCFHPRYIRYCAWIKSALQRGSKP